MGEVISIRTIYILILELLSIYIYMLTPQRHAGALHGASVENIEVDAAKCLLYVRDQFLNNVESIQTGK